MCVGGGRGVYKLCVGIGQSMFFFCVFINNYCCHEENSSIKGVQYRQLCLFLSVGKILAQELNSCIGSGHTCTCNFLVVAVYCLMYERGGGSVVAPFTCAGVYNMNNTPVRLAFHTL